MARQTLRVVLKDARGRVEEIDVAESTIEMSIPFGVSFTALGAIPTHTHDYASGEATIGSFVPREHCRRCQIHRHR